MMNELMNECYSHTRGANNRMRLSHGKTHHAILAGDCLHFDKNSDCSSDSRMRVQEAGLISPNMFT